MAGKASGSPRMTWAARRSCATASAGPSTASALVSPDPRSTAGCPVPGPACVPRPKLILELFGICGPKCSIDGRRTPRSTGALGRKVLVAPPVCPWPGRPVAGESGRMLTSNGYVLDESARRLGELEPVPDHERHDRDALWERLRCDGYLFLRGALDPDTVNGFREHYFRSFAGIGLTAA